MLHGSDEDIMRVWGGGDAVAAHASRRAFAALRPHRLFAARLSLTNPPPLQLPDWSAIAGLVQEEDQT
jgi:hypothetical protein